MWSVRCMCFCYIQKAEPQRQRCDLSREELKADGMTLNDFCTSCREDWGVDVRVRLHKSRDAPAGQHHTTLRAELLAEKVEGGVHSYRACFLFVATIHFGAMQIQHHRPRLQRSQRPCSNCRQSIPKRCTASIVWSTPSRRRVMSVRECFSAPSSMPRLPSFPRSQPLSRVVSWPHCPLV